jgi:hypothetical protein
MVLQQHITYLGSMESLIKRGEKLLYINKQLKRDTHLWWSGSSVLRFINLSLFASCVAGAYV